MKLLVSYYMIIYILVVLRGIGDGDSSREIGFLCSQFVKAILRFRIFSNFVH
jgi:hypothetical protein